MLERIYIHNFRTFVNFEWKPPRTCVLVGANGTGKTALVEVIWLLQDLVLGGDEVDAAFGSTRTAWLDQAKQTVEIELKIEGRSFRYRVDLEAVTGRPALAETLSIDGVLLYRSANGQVELFGNDGNGGAARTTIPFDRRRSFLAALEPRPDNVTLLAFRKAIASIRAWKPAPWMPGTDAEGESDRLDRDLSNFSRWYRSRVQDDPEGTEHLRNELRGVLQGFGLLRLETISSSVKELRAKFLFGEKSYELSWANLSDGQRALIALYAMVWLGLPRDSLVILDECETHVGPREIQPWLHRLLEATREANTQLLVVSHHPASIDYLAADTVWRLTRDPNGGHTRVEPLPIDLDAGETASEVVAMGSLHGWR